METASEQPIAVEPIAVEAIAVEAIADPGITHLTGLTSPPAVWNPRRRQWQACGCRTLRLTGRERHPLHRCRLSEPPSPATLRCDVNLGQENEMVEGLTSLEETIKNSWTLGQAATASEHAPSTNNPLLFHWQRGNHRAGPAAVQCWPLAVICWPLAVICWPLSVGRYLVRVRWDGGAGPYHFSLGCGERGRSWLISGHGVASTFDGGRHRGHASTTDNSQRCVSARHRLNRD